MSTFDTTVLHKLSYGLYAIAVMDAGKPCGCIVNTVFQVTSKDPIIALCMNKNNYTHDAIFRAGRFSAVILSEDTPAQVIGEMGFHSSADYDKFAHVAHGMIGGVPAVDEQCAGTLVCEVLSSADAETHTVILARVIDTKKGAGKPMTYDYYHTVIKGTAPKNAPTYVAPPQEAAPAAAKKKFVCDVCGYIYEGESVPPDFRCPVCGADASHFKEVK